MGEWDELPFTDLASDPEAVLPNRARVRAHALANLRKFGAINAKGRGARGSLRSACSRTDRADGLLRDFSKRD